MPRASSRRSSRSTPRRKVAWMGGTTDPATVTAGAQTAVNLTSTLEDTTENPIGKRGLTIVRTHATLRINSTDASLSAEMSFGLIMMDGDAVAASAYPDPLQDPEASWLHWARRVLLPASDSQQHLELDIKAKRRFRGNDDNLMLILQNDDATQSFEFAFGFRLLLMLP